MEKSRLDLTGRTLADVKREFATFCLHIEALSEKDKNDPNYKESCEDMQDRMRGFKNYFSQDLQAVLGSVKNK